MRYKLVILNRECLRMICNFKVHQNGTYSINFYTCLQVFFQLRCNRHSKVIAIFYVCLQQKNKGNVVRKQEGDTYILDLDHFICRVLVCYFQDGYLQSRFFKYYITTPPKYHNCKKRNETFSIR